MLRAICACTASTSSMREGGDTVQPTENRGREEDDDDFAATVQAVAERLRLSCAAGSGSDSV